MVLIENNDSIEHVRREYYDDSITNRLYCICFVYLDMFAARRKFNMFNRFNNTTQSLQLFTKTMRTYLNRYCLIIQHSY